MSTESNARCGYVAIVGRPNVGKSTLLNALVGEKVSIVSSRPHTTRHRILGVLNRGDDQALFIDTPGHARRSRRVLHRLMAGAFQQAVADADLVLVVVDAAGLTDEDRQLAALFTDRAAHTVLVVNKIDRLKSRSQVLPLLQQLGEEYPFAAFVPLSALRGDNLDALTEEIFSRLPEGPALFPRDVATDRGLQFRIAEIVREKLMEALHDELPYGLTVELDHLGRNEDDQWVVHALIWLERENHKAIVIGKGGQQLKEIGRAARLELMTLLDGRVHLEMWVKVRARWSDSEHDLRRFGYDLP